MQVDIFYQDLSYEEIEQNIAFEFLSLLRDFLDCCWELLFSLCVN